MKNTGMEIWQNKYDKKSRPKLKVLVSLGYFHFEKFQWSSLVIGTCVAKLEKPASGCIWDFLEKKRLKMQAVLIDFGYVLNFLGHQIELHYKPCLAPIGTVMP